MSNTINEKVPEMTTPLTRKQALRSKHSKDWIDVMGAEFHSMMKSNKVFKEVPFKKPSKIRGTNKVVSGK